MDWTTKAATLVLQAIDTGPECRARRRPRTAPIDEPSMGPAHAVYRFDADLPPGWFAETVPAVALGMKTWCRASAGPAL